MTECMQRMYERSGIWATAGGYNNGGSRISELMRLNAPLDFLDEAIHVSSPLKPQWNVYCVSGTDDS